MKKRILILLSCLTCMSGCNDRPKESLSNSKKVAPESSPQANSPNEKTQATSIKVQDYISSPIGRDNINNYLTDVALYVIYDYANPQQLYSTYKQSNGEQIFDLRKNDFSSYEAKDKFTKALPDIQKHAKFGEKDKYLIVPILNSKQGNADFDKQVIGIKPYGLNSNNFEHQLGSNFFSLDTPKSKMGRDFYLGYEGKYTLKNITAAFFFIDGIKVQNESEARQLENLVQERKVGLRGNLYLEFPQADENNKFMRAELKNSCINDCTTLGFKFKAADVEFYNFETGSSLTNKVRLYPTAKMETNEPFNYIFQK